MTHFEYLSVSVAIVLSLAAARAIGGLPHALKAERRYWLHASWIFLWLWVLVASWWNIWSYRSVDFDFIAFLVLLSPSGALLFLTSALVPENPDSVSAWRTHFREARVRHFVAASTFWGLLLVHQPALYSVPVLNVSSLAIVALLAIAVVGAMVENVRIQATVFVLTAATVVVFFSDWS